MKHSFASPDLSAIFNQRLSWCMKKYQVMSPDRVRVPTLFGLKCLLLLCSLQMCEMTRRKIRRSRTSNGRLWGRWWIKSDGKTSHLEAWHKSATTPTSLFISNTCSIAKTAVGDMGTHSQMHKHFHYSLGYALSDLFFFFFSPQRRLKFFLKVGNVHGYSKKGEDLWRLYI